jgi:hypothetical protein
LWDSKPVGIENGKLRTENGKLKTEKIKTKP